MSSTIWMSAYRIWNFFFQAWTNIRDAFLFLKLVIIEHWQADSIEVNIYSDMSSYYVSTWFGVNMYWEFEMCEPQC